MFLDAHRCRRAALDGTVVGGNDATDAGHIANAGDAAAALNALGTVVVVHAKARERREFKPRRAAVDHQRDALARQQLLTGTEPVTLRI